MLFTEHFKEVDTRYALALYNAVFSIKLLEKIAKEIRELKALFAQSKELLFLLHAPIFSNHERVKALQILAVKMNLSEVMQSFLRVVSLNNRTNHLIKIFDAYEALVMVKNNIALVNCISAHELDIKTQNEISKVFTKILEKNVELACHISPSILGGVVISYRSQLWDFSISTLIDDMKNQAYQTIAHSNKQN